MFCPNTCNNLLEPREQVGVGTNENLSWTHAKAQLSRQLCLSETMFKAAPPPPGSYGSFLALGLHRWTHLGHLACAHIFTDNRFGGGPTECRNQSITIYLFNKISFIYVILQLTQTRPQKLHTRGIKWLGHNLVI
jgi:hypothetical protein